jgi:DeoR/GlpR family transcriptional regulator of sugar metabolism
MSEAVGDDGGQVGRDRARPVHGVDRRHLILERVAAEQTIHVGELARELGVSEMTIRRDIRRLERDGFVRQTYGGATAHLTRSLDVSFNARALRHAREKRLIGMRATSLVEGCRLLFLGIGTTVEQFARYLPARADLTVVTASLPIASLLGTRPVGVVALGGTVLRDELSCGGPIATAALARYHFDAAVIGAAGLSVRWGITELTGAEAEVQRAAIERADTVIVLADGSKLGTATTEVVGPIERVDVLVTEPSAPPAELAAIEAAGIRVVIAERADRSSGTHAPRRRGRDATTSLVGASPSA